MPYFACKPSTRSQREWRVHVYSALVAERHGLSLLSGQAFTNEAEELK
jgi:hypothetical protein